MAFCAVSLTLVSYLLAGQKPDYCLVCFIFFAGLWLYNLNRIIYKNYKKRFFYLQLIAFSGMSICFFFLSYPAQLFIFHLGVLAILYKTPSFFNRLPSFSLRQIPFLKIILITYCWTSVTTVLPFVPSQNIWREEVLFLVIERFFFVFSLAIFFDIGDYFYDKEKALRTIPTLIGVKAAKICVYLLFTAFWFLGLLRHRAIALHIALSFFYFIGMLIIYRGNEHTPKMYYKRYVDGLLILYFLLVVASHFL